MEAGPRRGMIEMFLNGFRSLEESSPGPVGAGVTVATHAAGMPDAADPHLFLLDQRELDHHHLKLLQCLKDLVTSSLGDDRERAAAAASDLFEAWMAHCKAEKALMEACDWPDQKPHLVDHNRLTLAISTLLCEQGQGGGPLELAGMAEFFIRYLREHLDRYDRPLALHLQAQDHR